MNKKSVSAPFQYKYYLSRYGDFNYFRPIFIMAILLLVNGIFILILFCMEEILEHVSVHWQQGKCKLWANCFMWWMPAVNPGHLTWDTCSSSITLCSVPAHSFGSREQPGGKPISIVVLKIKNLMIFNPSATYLGIISTHGGKNLTSRWVWDGFGVGSSGDRGQSW